MYSSSPNDVTPRTSAEIESPALSTWISLAAETTIVPYRRYRWDSFYPCALVGWIGCSLLSNSRSLIAYSDCPQQPPGNLHKTDGKPEYYTNSDCLQPAQVHLNVQILIKLPKKFFTSNCVMSATLLSCRTLLISLLDAPMNGNSVCQSTSVICC